MDIKNNILRLISIIIMFAVIIFVVMFGLLSLGVIDNPYEKKPEDISLSQSEIRLKRNKSFQLDVKILPNNMKNQKIVFVSDKPDVVSVNKITSYLEAKRNGIATVTAYLDRYKDIKSECLVIVSDNDIRVEQIVLSTKKVYLEVNNEYKIKYKIVPKEATLHEFEYMTSDPKVAVVSQDGKIKGIGTGTALVVVSDKVSGVYEEVEVNVYERNTNGYPKTLKLNPKELKISVGGSGQIEASITPDGAKSDLIYESLDSNIATVSDLGVVTGIKEGTTKILATTINGLEDYVTVKVTNDIIKVKGISISNRNITMNVGESTKLGYKINPSNATNQGVVITSGDEDIIKVDGTKLIAINSGSTSITVKTNDGNYSDKANVTVNKVGNIIFENNINLNKTSVNIIVGGSDTVKATVTPSNATYKSVIWSSENPQIATVSDGLIVGTGVGKTNIIVTSAYKKISKKISVTVREQEVKGVSLDKTNATLTVGDSFTLVKTISPSNATNKNVTWTSSNNNIATVNNGTVNAINVGTVTITVKTVNGKSASCIVTVKANAIPVSEVRLDKQMVKTTVNNRIYLTATVSPSNATNKKVLWSSDNQLVAKVSDGVIETVGVGTAKITATSVNGKKATCDVIVTSDNDNVEVTKVELDRSSLSLKVGNKDTLRVTITPSNATNKNVLWSSSNTSVATVSNGVITAYGVGESVITVTTTNGLKASCKVTVTSNETQNPTQVTGITLNPSSKTIAKGEKLMIQAQISPSNAVNKNLTWTSNKPDVASVNSNGEVTGIKGGTVHIKATSSNGISAVSVITVSGNLTPTISLVPRSAEYTGDAITANQATINVSSATIKYTYYTNNTCTKKTTDANGASSDGKAPKYVGNYYVKASVEKTSSYNASESACVSHTITKSSNIDTAFYDRTTINNVYFGITKGKDVSRSVAEKNREAINKAIEYAWNNGIQEIKLVKNDYVIDVQNSGTHKGIVINHSNINFNLNGAEIRLYPNNYAKYIMIYILNVDNSNVYNGSVIGDKSKHTCTNSGKLLADTYPACPNSGEPSSTHQMGYGIMIHNSKNIKLHDLKVHDMTGDGIIIQDSMSSGKNLTDTIDIYDNKIYNNRRQGISIICGKNINIKRNEIYNIKGNPPQAGIDIEPDDNYHKISNVVITNNNIHDTKGYSVSLGVCPNHLSSITIKNNTNDKPVQYCSTVKNIVISGNTKDKENISNNCINDNNHGTGCNG